MSVDYVDFVLSPQGIARELEQIGRHPYTTHASPIETQAASPEADDGLEQTLALLRNHSGVNFALYKQTTLNRHVWRRMALRKIHNPREYVNYLQANPDEISTLYQDILIHVTGFFRDPPFSRLDMVSCRNLLIYLGPSLQKKVLPFFEETLRPGGFLLLVTSEDFGGTDEYFTLMDKKNKIYSRKSAVPRLALGVTTASLLSGRERSGKRKGDLPTGFEVQKEVDRVLLGKYTPAGIVVSFDLEILQFRGRTGPFLEPSPGQPCLSLPKMAREGLLAVLRQPVILSKNPPEPRCSSLPCTIPKR
ncbi:MAG: hypothetical protein HY508_12290 [Acidobacteria bacterium]|nr:hypothetical protein [Acidobacteriota bacterium]